jgi:hypothetical protein
MRGGQAGPLDGMGWMAPVGAVEPNDQSREREQVRLHHVHVDTGQGDPFHAHTNQPPPPQYTPGNYFLSNSTPTAGGGDTTAPEQASIPEGQPPAYPAVVHTVAKDS